MMDFHDMQRVVALSGKKIKSIVCTEIPCVASTDEVIEITLEDDTILHLTTQADNMGGSFFKVENYGLCGGNSG